MQDIVSDMDLRRFQRDGFVVLNEAVSRTLRDNVVERIHAHLQPLLGPVEYEAEVGYPGAPQSIDAAGGLTPRRLLHAYARDESFRQLAHAEPVCNLLTKLLGDCLAVSQCHHNCVMTKHPGFSSATSWHQDIRYWSFDRPELISAWFALGDENRTNGALRVIPGSHLHNLDRGRLDRDLFLRTDLEENRELIRTSQSLQLAPGDVLLFHCRLFHAAGKNLTDRVKLSPVFTYHACDNLPIPGTRSATLPSIRV